MFKKILSLFKKSKIQSQLQPPAPHASASADSNTATLATVAVDGAASASVPHPVPEKTPGQEAPVARWMESTESGNPFGVAGCDCFQFTQTMISTTTEEAVMQFFNLRGDFGKHLIGTMPNNPVSIACQLAYAYEGEVEDGAVFKASKMEEKWDIYLYQSRLYFCRSWTGALIFVVDVRFADKKVLFDRIHVSSEMIDDDADYIVRQVDYLNRSHVYRQVHPHPLPRDFPRDVMAIAALSFKTYGDKCCFATYEDTITLVSPPRRLTRNEGDDRNE